MFQKLYEVLEGTIALVALLAIVGISTFSVIVLNPTAGSPKPEVAGVNTEPTIPVSNNSLLINNLAENDPAYSSSIVSLGLNNGYQYTSKIKPSGKMIEKKFIEIFNSNNQDLHLSFETEISGGVQDELKIRVMDNKDTLLIYSPETGVNKVSLTIPANSRRALNIQYEFTKNINFSFEVNIKLK